MKKRSLLFVVCIVSMTLVAQVKTVKPQPKPAEPSVENSGKVFGTIFTDYSFIVQEPDQLNAGKGVSGRNAFSVRRAQIGYEQIFSKEFSARIVYDPSLNTVQEGNVEWRDAVPMVDVTVGVAHTLASETSEKVWGYRSLDRMILERTDQSGEFDIGTSIGARLNPQGTMYCNGAVYNGVRDINSENKNKKFALNFGNWFDKFTVLELYADYENLNGGQNAMTGKVLVGMSATKFAVGVDAFFKINHFYDASLTKLKDFGNLGLSLFSWFEIAKGTRAVIRIDGSDADINTTKTGYRELYVNGGVDYTPLSEVHFIPNVVYVKQLKKGSATTVADYVEARLTAAVYFPSFK